MLHVTKCMTVGCVLSVKKSDCQTLRQYVFIYQIHVSFGVVLLRCHFFSKSVGVDRCFHEKVGGRFQFRCLYMLTQRRCTTIMTYSLELWA